MADKSYASGFESHSSDSPAVLNRPEESGASLKEFASQPVFSGFDAVGLTGRDIAEIASVTPPTVSKWRSAKIRIPADKVVFLTWVLAHVVEEVAELAALEDRWGLDGPVWTGSQSPKVLKAQVALKAQEAENARFGAEPVRKGATLFRDWWAHGGAEDLQGKRFRLRLQQHLRDEGQFASENGAHV